MADLFLKSVFIWFEHVQLIPLQICETPYKSLHGFKGGGRNRETYIFKILCLLSLLFMPIKSTILSQFDIDVDLPNALNIGTDGQVSQSQTDALKQATGWSGRAQRASDASAR